MSKSNCSHPMSLRNNVKKTLQRECVIPVDSKIILGVSGGPDSMALLNVMAGLQEELHFKLYAVGIDHQLRDESEQEINVAKTYSEYLNVPFQSIKVMVDGRNIQESARKERYRAFLKCKNDYNADFIATAHHADDLAETVLMRIIKGTYVASQPCMNPHYGDILRPMLRASKRDVCLHIKRKNIPYSIDPSNENRKYLRTKVRYDIMPKLKEINPNVLNALCKLSDDCI